MLDATSNAGRTVEPEALAVEAVDELARLRFVERDDLDRILPAQTADLESPQGWIEPVAEPVVALPGIVFDPPADWTGAPSRLARCQSKCASLSTRLAQSKASVKAESS